MSKFRAARPAVHMALLACFLAAIGGCDKLTFPRLFWEQKPQPRLPISVTYLFDPSLSQRTERVEACGLSHTIEVGDLVTKTFLDASADRFANVSALYIQDRAMPASVSSDLSIRLSLVDFAFVPVTKTGEEDRYQAEVVLRLHAVYQDAHGNVLAQTPLAYQDRVNVWTPALSAQSTSCATGQFDGVIQTAAETLAGELLSVVPSLFGQQAPQAPARVQAPAASPSPAPGHSQAAARTPGLSFRTRLQDGNGNLVLESGEVIVLNVEVTNPGTAPVSAAFIEVNGDPVIVNAFTRAAVFPLRIGPLLPGEMQSMEIRGRMPDQVEPRQAELIVTIKPAEGRPPGPHKILAAIEPVTFPGKPADTRGGDSRRSSAQSSPSRSRAVAPYYAVIVALDRYRDPWPNAYTVASREVEGLIDTLHATGMFHDDQIRVLRGQHAMRADIETALFSWAKTVVDPRSVLLFYFAGHAVTDERGEIFLVPYEGSPTAPKSRLISLRQLQRVLGALHPRVALLFLDTPVVQALGSSRIVGLDGRSRLEWHAGIPKPLEARTGRVIQIRRRPHGQRYDPGELLSGLLGRADRNQDGEVTIGEFLKDVQGAAEIRPPLAETDPVARIPLAR